IDRICRDHSYIIQTNYNDDVVRLSKAAGYAPHAGRSGAFRYVANSFQLYRNVELALVNPRGAAPATRPESLTLSLTLFAEPRLPSMHLGHVRVEAAYDNENHSLLPRRSSPDPFGGPFPGMVRRSYLYGGGNKQINMQTSLNLHRGSSRATSVKLLRGVVPVTVLVEQKPVVLAEKILKGKGKKKTIDDVSFTILDVTKVGNNQYQV